MDREKYDCAHCWDKGFIETGNNDLPCEHCPKGATTVFSDGRTGREVLAGYNAPYNERRPPAWEEEDVDEAVKKAVERSLTDEGIREAVREGIREGIESSRLPGAVAALQEFFTKVSELADYLEERNKRRDTEK